MWRVEQRVLGIVTQVRNDEGLREEDCWGWKGRDKFERYFRELTRTVRNAGCRRVEFRRTCRFLASVIEWWCRFPK